MRSGSLVALGLLPALWLTGCGQSSTNTQVSESPAAETATQVADSPVNAVLQDKQASPNAIVQAFLDAAKNRDRNVAEQLLTKAARRETEREGLVIDPPGTPQMTYEVGEAEIAEENPTAAYVKVRWFEDTNQTESSEIIWVLRKESQGWRIAGMTTPQADGQYLTWNFEEPTDMQEIRRQLSAEPEDWSDSKVTPASGTSEPRPENE